MTKDEISKKLLQLFERYIINENGLKFRGEIDVKIPDNIEDIGKEYQQSKDYVAICKDGKVEMLIKSIDGFWGEEEIDNRNVKICVKNEISDELCITILNMLPMERLRFMLPMNHLIMGRYRDSKGISVFDFLRIVFRGFATLTIQNLNKERPIDYIQYAKSFVFNAAMLQDKNFLLVENIEFLLIELKRNPIRRRYANGIDIPYRKYIDEVVQYFIEGNSARAYKIKFLSFYNVLEYFYDKVYIDDKCAKIQQIITSPKFNHNNLSSYKKVLEVFDIKKAKNLEKNFYSEQESLKLLLAKHIDLNEFREFLKYYNFYMNNDAYKISNTAMSLTDSDDNLISKLSTRIYKVRNALVHSKDSETVRYIPQKDDNHIHDEIDLIRFVAQEVIISTSTLL